MVAPTNPNEQDVGHVANFQPISVPFSLRTPLLLLGPDPLDCPTFEVLASDLSLVESALIAVTEQPAEPVMPAAELEPLAAEPAILAFVPSGF